MISRWKTLVPVLALTVCLGWMAQASAAVLDYYGDGGFYYQCTATAASSSDSVSGWTTDTKFVGVNPTTSTVESNPGSSIAFFSNPGTSEVNIGLNANIHASSSDKTGYMSGSSYIGTQDQNGVPGYFLRIGASGGEQTGDTVNLRLFWSYELTGDLAGSASTGSMSIRDITANTLIMSYGSQDSVNGNSNLGKLINYQAQIGDIIGIFMEGSANLDHTGAEGLYLNSQQFVDITATPLPGAIWLLGSGLAALAGFRRRRQS